SSGVACTRSSAGRRGVTDFLQLAIQGIALGAVYALIALGFVIVYKATQVINFAQGELVLLGAYLVYAFNQTALPFAVSVALLVAFFVFFRFTRAGIGMRATAIDQEAALAVGIPVRGVFAQAWMIAGAVAAIAGVLLVAFPATLHPAVGFTALRAFPAAIVG